MLEGEKVRLRLLEEDDLPLRVKWVNTPEIRQNLMFDYPISLAKTRRWFQNSLLDASRVHFSILDAENGKVIGMTGLLDIDHRHRRAQFYVTIGEMEYWGRGIADEVIRIVLQYGFVEMNLNKIYLYTLDGNARARSVYERNGFVEEGILRQHHFCVGRFQDLHHYSILREEWRSCYEDES